MNNENLLILDIDETLIHSSEKELSIPYDFYILNTYYVYKRPFLIEFLDWAFSKFQIGIWSAAGEIYVKHILSLILNDNQIPKFIYHSKNCTRKFDIDPYNGEYPCIYDAKRIQKLKKRYNLSRILVLDDNIKAHCHNYGNLVHIKEFNPSKEDDALIMIQPYIEAWFKEKDVRTIEKRFWSTSGELGRSEALFLPSTTQ